MLPLVANGAVQSMATWLRKHGCRISVKSLVPNSSSSDGCYLRRPGRSMRRFSEKLMLTKCLFVLSTGRVGTQTVAQVLSLSSDIDAVHERRPRLLALTRRCYQIGISDVDAVAREFVASRSDFIRQAYHADHWYAETSNRITYLAPALAATFPRAKFIHLHRHPAEVVRSGMRRRWYNGHSEDRFRIEPRVDDAFRDQWQDWSEFEKVCWYWHAVNRYALDFFGGLANDRILSLRSADLFLSCSGASRVFELLNVTAPPHAEIKRVLARRCNAQRQGTFPEYEHWSTEQRRKLKDIAFSTAAELGYHLGC